MAFHNGGIIFSISLYISLSLACHLASKAMRNSKGRQIAQAILRQKWNSKQIGVIREDPGDLNL